MYSFVWLTKKTTHLSFSYSFLNLNFFFLPNLFIPFSSASCVSMCGYEFGFQNFIWENVVCFGNMFVFQFIHWHMLSSICVRLCKFV
jgi:hypothetical protein